MSWQDILIDIGTSSASTTSWTPYNTLYYDNKIQFLLLASELLSFGIGGFSKINALSLKASQQPGRSLANLRIRIKETTDDTLSAWHTEDLQLVYHATSVNRTFLTAGTVYKHEFNTEYIYLGGNLLIEISRDDSGYKSGGGLYVRNGLSSAKMLTGYQDSGYSFPFDNFPIRTTESQIPEIILSVLSNYKPLGTYETNSVLLDGQYRLRWISEVPENTSITIEYATGETQGQWQEASNGEVIDIDTNLWVKATLSTEDELVTPALQDLWIEPSEAPADTIRLIMNDYFRFNNVVGDLTVFYDGAGSLAGFDGPVEEFTESFTPIGLVPKPHQNNQEHIEISSVSATGKLTRIYFSDIDQAEDQGHIEVLGITGATGVLTHIDNI